MVIRRLKPANDVRQLGYLRLWRDDLAEMVKTIREVSNQVRIVAGDYEIDEVDELTKLAEMGQSRLTSFQVAGLDPPLRLDLSKTESKVEADDPGMAAKGAMRAIEELAAKRRRRFPFRLQSVMLSGIATPQVDPPRTILVTQTRVEAPTWWQRHRSNVVIHVVVGALFFGLGILVGKV